MKPAILPALCLVLDAVLGSDETGSGSTVFRPAQVWNESVGKVDAQLQLRSGLELGSFFSWQTDFFKRQQETCEYPVTCPGGESCCPADTQCCENIPKCCPEDNICVTKPAVGCCPDIAQRCGGFACAVPGTVCCTNYVCKEGYTCNEIGGQQGCCPDGWLGCEGGCCPEGSTCGAEPGECLRTSSTTQRQTQTKATSKAVSTTRTIAATTITESKTVSATRAAASGSCSVGAQRRYDKTLEERARTPKYPYSCVPECIPATGESMPVWELKSIPGKTDQLVYSMCRGINARVQSAAIQSGLSDGEDILSWNGPNNRQQVINCDGFCTKARQATGIPYECDEYPPAAFNPPKGAQTRLCIDGSQNSRTQGPMLSAFVNQCLKKKDDKMLVRIVGGCSQFMQTPPPRMLMPREEGRQQQQQQQQHDIQSNVIQLSASNGTLSDPLNDGSLLYIAVEIGEISNGAYDLGVSFNGTVENVTVLDNDGIVYANVDSPTGVTHLSFTVDDADNGLSLALIAYASQAVNVSYTGTATLASSSTATVGPSSTTSRASAASNDSQRRPGLAWLIGASLFVVALTGL